MVMADKMAEDWLSRLQADYPDQSSSVCQSIVRWLLGNGPERFDSLPPEQLKVAQQSIEYRYRILQQRYWQTSPDRAYQQLVKRVSGLFLVRNKIRTWISLSRDRRRTVVDVVQEVIQEMMRSDRHLARELQWIADCSENPRLRNLLMLASIEEYCLRPIRNQPLIMYRFVNYLRRSQRGGMTQVPTGELIRLVSDEVAPDEAEDSLSLLDREAWNHYQEEQNQLEQQALRTQVKTSFIAYLHRHLGQGAVDWLELHLQGFSQEAIAQRLDLPVQQVYRLREKISYHALKIFALKEQPAMVLGWLKTSLQDHNFGLTPTQWQAFWQALTPDQQVILEASQAGQSMEEIARRLALKPKQIQSQWVKLYLKAQELRTPGES